jgi:hypothetical protein
VAGLAPSVVATIASAAPGLEPAVPGRPIDAWAWCGVHPDDPTAAVAARSMATVAGIDATFGPCSDPFDPEHGYPYSPEDPGERYVSPQLYRRLVDINAAAGMKTVVYDARLWDPSPAVRNQAITEWLPVTASIAAWDLGDEFHPDDPMWDTLIERWDLVLADATARTGIMPFANQLDLATDDALADLEGSDLLLSFTQYSGDLGAALARQLDPHTNVLMCGINVLDHGTYHPTADKIRNGMTSLIAAGCDRFLVFGGQRVYDSSNFGDVSLVDGQGIATQWAPAVMEGSGHSSYTPVGPARLLETRAGEGLSTIDGMYSGIGTRDDDSVTQLQISGRAGIPDRAVAVVLDVTVIDPVKPGFITIYPCGTRPNASQLNYAAGQTVTTTVVAKVTSAAVCVFTLSEADLVVDVNGFYPEGTSFEAIAPARLLETRSGDDLATTDGQFYGIGRRAAGSVTQLTVGGRGGVPASASAVALSVTVTGATAPGFITVFPCGGSIPTAATLNYAAGATVSNAAIVQTGPGGTVCIYSMNELDLIVDVNGYHPVGATLKSVQPARLVETRTGTGLSTVDGLQNGIGLRLSDAVTPIQVVSRAGAPRVVASVVLNVTITEPRRDGFVVLYACGDPRPNAAHLNFTAGTTVSNMVVADVSGSGTVCLYTMVDTHVVIDITGYHL